MVKWNAELNTPVVRYTILSVVGLASTIAIFIMGVNRESRVRAFRDHGVIVQGTVTHVREVRSTGRRGRSRTYHPNVAFTTEEGRSVQAEVSSSTSNDYTAGQQVQIRYLPEAPEKAEIEGSGAQDHLNLFAMVALVLLLVVGINASLLRTELMKTRSRSGLEMGWKTFFAICAAVGGISLIGNASVFFTSLVGEDKVLSKNPSATESTVDSSEGMGDTIAGGVASEPASHAFPGVNGVPIPDFVKHGALGPKSKLETP